MRKVILPSHLWEIWGKTDDLSKAELRGQSKWLPLVTHLMDTASVAGHLWDNIVGQQAHRVFTIQDESSDEAKLRMMFLAGTHDIGKATPAFLMTDVSHVTATNRNTSIESSGLLLSQVGGISRQEWHHSDLALPIMTYWYMTRFRTDIIDSMKKAHKAFTLDLAELYKKNQNNIASNSLLPRDDPQSQKFGIGAMMGYILAAHHGSTPNIQKLKVLMEVVENLVNGINDRSDCAKALGWNSSAGDWLTAQMNILDAIALAVFEVDNISELGENPVFNNVIGIEKAIAFAGTITISDWIASSTWYYPINTNPIEWNPKRDVNGWDRFSNQGELQGWKPEEPPIDIFQQRWGFTPHAFQTQIIDTAKSLPINEGGVIVVETEMGGGKTAAALAAAEHFAYRNGSSGVVFGMPTMATANEIMKSVTEWANDLDSSNPITAYLAHSRNTLEKQYDDLMQSDKQLYISESLTGHLGILASMTTATIDQIASLALRNNRASSRMAAVHGRVVIFDEVHSYDEYTMAYVQQTMEMLGASKTPVIILSATLPAVKKMRLMNAYRDGWYLGDSGSAPKYRIANDAVEKMYPALTVFSADNPDVVTVEGIRSSAAHLKRSINVSFDHEDDPVPAIVKAIQGNINTHGGGSYGVIRNTVEAAQITADELSQAFPDAEIHLIHSRFTFNDRAKIINNVVHTFGKNGEVDDLRPTPSNGKVGIVVATQVVEQSIDLDFDWMYSDIAPIDSLLQRFGREFRHPRVWRTWMPDVLIGMIQNVDTEQGQRWAAPKESYIELIYSKYLISQSMSILQKHLRDTSNKINLPDDIATLIAAFDAPYEQDLLDNGSLDTSSESENMLKMKEHQSNLDNRKWSRGKAASIRSIRSQDKSTLLEKYFNAETLSTATSIRETQGSLEFIVIARDAHGLYVMDDNLPGTRVYLSDNLYIPATRDDVNDIGRTVARSVVTIPWSANPPYLVQPQSWSNGVLAGKGCVIEDESGFYVIGDKKYTYSSDEGLRLIR